MELRQGLPLQLSASNCLGASPGTLCQPCGNRSEFINRWHLPCYWRHSLQPTCTCPSCGICLRESSKREVVLFDDKLKKATWSPKGCAKWPVNTRQFSASTWLVESRTKPNKLPSSGYWQSTPTALAALKNR